MENRKLEIRRRGATAKFPSLGGVPIAVGGVVQYTPPPQRRIIQDFNLAKLAMMRLVPEVSKAISSRVSPPIGVIFVIMPAPNDG